MAQNMFTSKSLADWGSSALMLSQETLINPFICAAVCNTHTHKSIFCSSLKLKLFVLPTIPSITIPKSVHASLTLVNR